MLLYNIWLETASIGFGILLIAFYKIQYKTRYVINQRFEALSWSVLGLTVTDVLSAVTISFYATVPIWLNYLLNAINYMFIGISALMFIRYIRTLMKREISTLAQIEIVLLLVYCASEVINLFFGFFFSFDETGYIHGPLYLVPILYNYLFIVDAAVLLIRYRKMLSMRKTIGTSSYIILMLIVALLQAFLIPEVLLTGFASTMSLYVIYFLMETPDYYRLLDTMKELELAKSKANAANEAKSRFLANMSHEIRTPLNAVLGMDEMILREAATPEIIEYAKEIKSSGKALLGIINDILDFSKIESGAMDIVPNDYAITSVVKNIHMMLSSRAQQKGLQLNVNMVPDMPKLLNGDEMRISQILTNLLTNAIKYTMTGSITVNIGLKPSSEHDHIVLCMSVTDTGIGIKADDKDKLFEEFERVDIERNRTIEGTGLGLAIVSRIVRLMNGTISVDSVYGQGSTFSVEIPQLVKDGQPIGEFRLDDIAVEVETYQQTFNAPNLRILAVDDNLVNLTVIKNLLKNTGVKLICVLSGADALKCMEKNKIDIVLLDHMMPVMDGIETLKRARALEEQTGFKPKYVALTANAVGGAKDMYLREGFDAYISKPINPKVLEDTLSRLSRDNNE